MMRASVWAVVLVLGAACVWAQEEVTVTGSVVGPEGEAIAEARVACGYYSADGRAWVETTTQGDGRFELTYTTSIPAKSRNLVVTAEGYAIAWLWGPPGEDVEITLTTETAAISGTVTDPDGEPLAGVDVRVRSLLEQGTGIERGDGVYFGGWDRAPGALTDEQGRFSIGALPVGYQVSLWAEREGLADYYRSTPEDWPVTGDDILITMSPEAVIAGRVIREGEPVADVKVGAQVNDEGTNTGSSWGDDTTGPDGRYEIQGLLASTYNVALTPPEGYTAVAHEGVEVAAGERREGIDFELIEGVVLTGAVTWADNGEPVVGAAVAAYGPAHPKSSAWVQGTKTDADGRYELRLPPGRNYIYWQGSPSEAWYSEPEKEWVELEEGADQTLDFRLFRKPIITLTVLNPDGTPAAGAAVQWHAAESYRTVGQDAGFVTDEHGQVELTFGRPVGPGRDALAAALAQDTERDLAGLAIINGETDREATIRLQQAAWIVASVQDREGQPLSGVDVFAWVRRDDGWGSLSLDTGKKTDADGKARLGPLPAGVPLTVGGKYELVSKAVSSPDEARQPVELNPGQTLTLEPYVLIPEGYSLRGTVVDAEGNPVEGALVIAGQTPELQTRTDAEGRFELRGLNVDRGASVIAALPDGSAAYAEPVDASVPLDVTIELAEPVTIVATVLGADGQPVTGASARIYSQGPLHGDLPGKLETHAEDLRTDAKGQFTAENLVAGLQYGVMAYTGDERAPDAIWGDEVIVLGGEGVIEMTLTRHR